MVSMPLRSASASFATAVVRSMVRRTEGRRAESRGRCFGGSRRRPTLSQDLSAKARGYSDCIDFSTTFVRGGNVDDIFESGRLNIDWGPVCSS